MIGDQKQQMIDTVQNQENSNLKLTITEFTFNKKLKMRPKGQMGNKHSLFMTNKLHSVNYKSRNKMNKIYTRKRNDMQFDKNDHNHIMFTNQKESTEHRSNMFLTWRERHNRLIPTSSHKDGIIHDIIKKIKSAEIKSESKLPYLSCDEQTNNTMKLKLKNRWQSSKEVHTPIELISRKLQCERARSKRQTKKLFQIKTIQKPILLSNFMDVNNKQKSCVLRISGWQANYGGIEDYNY